MNQNDINSTLHADHTLREAVSRREQKLPPMPADLNERLLKRMEQHDEKPRRSHLWLYSAIAVAAGILLLLVFTIGKGETDEQPTLAEQTIGQPAKESVQQPVEQPIVEDVQSNLLTAQRPMVKPTKKRRKAKPTKPVPVDEIDLAEISIDIPAANDAPAYYPVEQDPFQVMEAHAQNIRQRGLRLQEEIESLMNN